MSKAKSKNGKTTTQDYMNLLYSDSDSDSVPDLKLPPLKGKKPNKRRSSYSRRQGELDGGWSAWMILKTVTLVILLASVICLGVVTFWSLQEIRLLKDQINALENKNAGTPEEFQALQAKLLLVNKTVTELKSGKYGLDVLNKSITDMQKQITSLSQTNAALQKKVQSAGPDSQQVPVAKIVADMGSDLETSKSEVQSLKTAQSDLSKKLESLTARITGLESAGGRETGGHQIPLDLQPQLTLLNATFKQGMEKAAADINEVKTRLDTVEKFTQGVQQQLRNVSLQVQNISTTHSLPPQQGAEGSGPEAGPSGEVNTTASLLADLQDQVQNLQHIHQQMQVDHEDIAKEHNELQSLQGDFTDFKDDIFQDIHNLNSSYGTLNSSVSTLNADVESLFSKCGLAMSHISNLTGIVETLLNDAQSGDSRKTGGSLGQDTDTDTQENAEQEDQEDKADTADQPESSSDTQATNPENNDKEEG